MHFLSTEAKQTPETQKPKQFTKPPPTMFSYLHTPDLDRKRLIDSMIRVDQAGERGAISILNGQVLFLLLLLFLEGTIFICSSVHLFICSSSFFLKTKQ